MKNIHFTEEGVRPSRRHFSTSSKERNQYTFIKIILLWFLLAIPLAIFIFAQALKIITLNIFLFSLILFIAIIAGGFVSQYITNKYIHKEK